MGLTLTALGGLGEFGANSLLVDAGGERLLLDAGAAFSAEPALGVAFEVPDFAALPGPAPRAIVLTHAHDDHLKGLPVAAAAFPGAEVLGSQVTLAWQETPWRRLGPTARALRGSVAERTGAFEVTALPVSHSVPGTLALRVRTGQGTVAVLSDLRLAASALGEETDAEALARWGDEGVDVALLDATNALVDVEPPGESVVASTLGELIRGTDGAAVVVTFASHLGRFRQVALAAAAAGRVVVPVGRGLQESLRVQARLLSSGLPLGLVRPARELPELPRDRVVVVATGSQGERGSAFFRLAHDRLPGLHLRRGDRVIHAARVIPGHERELAVLLDHCVRQGAEVVTATQAPTHVSGHPHRAELAELLRLVRPRWVVPVHGWRRNLEAVAELAAAGGVPGVVAESFQELSLEGATLEPTGRSQPVGRLLFDDVDGARLLESTVWQRRAVARDGLVVALLVAGGRGGEAAPLLLQWGTRGGAETLRHLEGPFAREADRARLAARGDAELLRSTMTRWLKKEVCRAGGRRSLCEVIVVEADR